MAAFLTLWLAGLAAAAWVAWAILGSPPAVAGWLVLHVRRDRGRRLRDGGILAGSGHGAAL